jgi:hypothetical protein
MPTLQQSLLDHVFGRTTYTAPAALYLGFSTTTITYGVGATEPAAASGYSRTLVTNDAASWAAATVETDLSARKQNSVELESPTASAAWGTITDFFLATAVTGGTIIAHGQLTAPAAVDAGDSIAFAAGELVIWLE